MSTQRRKSNMPQESRATGCSLSLLYLAAWAAAAPALCDRSSSNFRAPAQAEPASESVSGELATTLAGGSPIIEQLVNQVLEQNRHVLAAGADRAPPSSPPRAPRQTARNESSAPSWQQLDDAPARSGSGPEVDLDRHIQYDTAPAGRLARSPTTEQPAGVAGEPANRAEGAGSSGRQPAAAEPEKPASRDAANGRSILHPAAALGADDETAPSAGLPPLPAPIRPFAGPQQHTRPPYAASDQFQRIAALELGPPSAATGQAEASLQKLAPAGQPVDLSPIPAQTQGSALDMERLYFLKDSLLPALSPHAQQQQQQTAAGAAPNRGAHNDRYATDEFRNAAAQVSTPSQASGPAELQEVAPEVQSRRHQLNFSASFLNVTAPIVERMSASEFMESELGAAAAAAAAAGSGQAMKSLMHQASGFMRPHAGSTTYQNGAPGTPPDQSIYSAPANQFVASPAPASDNENETQLDRDRLRLEPLLSALASAAGQQHQAAPPPLTAKRPASSAPAHYNATHRASGGFRSPGWPAAMLTSDGYAAPALHLQAPSLASVYPQVRNPPSASSTAQVPVVVPPGGGGGSNATSTTNGFITSSQQQATQQQQQQQQVQQQQVQVSAESLQSGNPANANRRLLNLTRVEHISADCSNDLIRTVIVFNGTFRGIIYSSGYVRDPNCIYINGTGKARYDFSIRLNQCGTLSRQELHPPAGPNEIRREDKVMWNTLSIQYNPIIEQEWDEHFRVSCEYGSDFWKTISFNPFNVETNTGSPVVFTIDPPQCQMEVLRGHGMVGPREAVSGPVTVGDPLTLLIHMKSEKSGYDILVKNCIAHNGGTQKMQLIDANGCVVNERFISPFRGTYNDNDLKHVTLYSYLKAFRFTGSPVLYLECDIHMCQSKCPPQMCYWRHLSKRSAAGNATSDELRLPAYEEHEEAEAAAAARGLSRRARKLVGGAAQGVSDKVSLFQALEVRHDADAAPREADASAYLGAPEEPRAGEDPFVCYRRAQVLGFLFAAGSLLMAAVSVAAGCCWRATSGRWRSGRPRAVRACCASPTRPRAKPAAPDSGSLYSAPGGHPRATALDSTYRKALECLERRQQQQQQQPAHWNRWPGGHKERLLAAHH